MAKSLRPVPEHSCQHRIPQGGLQLLRLDHEKIPAVRLPEHLHPVLLISADEHQGSSFRRVGTLPNGELRRPLQDKYQLAGQVEMAVRRLALLAEPHLGDQGRTPAHAMVSNIFSVTS